MEDMGAIQAIRKIVLRTLAVGSVLTALQYVGVWALSAHDPGSNWKYFALCEVVLWSLALFSACLSVSGRLRSVLPVLLLPLMMVVTELVNTPLLMRMSFHSGIFHYFVPCCLLAALLTWGAPRWRLLRALRSVVVYVLGCVCVALIANRVASGAGMSYDSVVAICQTTVKEGSYYFWHENNGVLLLLLVGVLMVLLVCAVRRMVGPEPPIRRSADLRFALAFFVLFSGCALAGWKASMYKKFLQPELWRLAWAPVTYAHNVRQYQEFQARRAEIVNQALASMSADARADVPDGVFVVLIGESQDRHLMGCYDGVCQTTPVQSDLRRRGDAVFFDCAYACFVQTVAAVPLAVCARNQYWPQETQKVGEVSFLDIARALGFKTVWISNQERVSSSNSPISVIADGADETVFLQDARDGAYDESMVDVLSKIDLGPRALVVLHFLGSHFPYDATYPSGFAFPESLSIYEKSVYYNDYVIGRCLDMFREKATAVIAFSDHADAVLAGKKHDPRPEKFDREMIDIPYWVWLSDRFKAERPDVVAALRRNAKYPITNDLTYDLVLGLMGVRSSGGDDRFRPTSDGYLLQTGRPLTLGGTLEIPDPLDPLSSIAGRRTVGGQSPEVAASAKEAVE